jgi:hypothetical protein
MSIRLKNGELKITAIKALVKAHNKLMDWDVKGLNRKQLIEFIEKKGYKVNHEKNQLDLTGSAMKRRPAKIVPIKKTTAELKQEMEKKTKAKATRERKKKQKEAVAKVGVPPLPTKETLKKVQTKKKMKEELKKGTVKTKSTSTSAGTQTEKPPTTTIGTRPKSAGRVDTSASAKGGLVTSKRVTPRERNNQTLKSIGVTTLDEFEENIKKIQNGKRYDELTAKQVKEIRKYLESVNDELRKNKWPRILTADFSKKKTNVVSNIQEQLQRLADKIQKEKK